MADFNDPGKPGVEYLPVPLGPSQPPVPVHSPGFFPVVASPPKATPWLLDFGGILKRYPFFSLVAVVACAVLGLIIGTLFKTNYWTIEGRLRFSLQRPDPGHATYDSMSLYSYADLFANEDLLRPVAAEFADQLPRDNPVRYLQKDVKVDTPRMADQIEVKIDAVDKDFGLKLVNRLMERHIEFTDQLRRNAVLQQGGKLLKSKIADATAIIKRMQTSCEEYRARVRANLPIEKLETADLDAYHSQRRKSLLEDIDKQKSDIKKANVDLDAKRLRVRQLQDLVEKKAVAPQDYETAKQEMSIAERQIKISEEQLRRTEDKFRLVPIEYAESEILKFETQRTVAQEDLKLLESKVANANRLRVPLYEVDHNDEEWNRLRLQLLGPDNSEFSILKPATAPAYPNVSNRKMLTALGFAVPMSLLYLALAGYDHLKRGRPGLLKPIIEGQPLSTGSASHAPQEESPLMKARMHQWLNGASPKRPSKSDASDHGESNKSA